MDFKIDLGKVGLTTGGEWKSTVSYERLTVVTKDGQSYVSKKDNKGVIPGSNSSVWQLVAAKGADGDEGSGGSTIEVIDNLTTNSGRNALSARQGKILKESLDDAIAAWEGGSGGGSTYTLPPASPTKLGGIQTGYAQNGKNYPVELNGQNQAFVNVPWYAGSGGEGSGYVLPAATSNALGGIRIGKEAAAGIAPVMLDAYNRAYVEVTGGTGGGYYEQAFCGTLAPTDESVITVPNLPSDGVPLDDTNWSHSAPDNSDNSLIIWMAVRWVSGGTSYDNWQGPWRISGQDGVAGTDGTQIEYIYTRTVSDEAEATPSRPTGSETVNPSSSATSYQDDDWYPVGWTDSPEGVTSEQRFEWMCFRTKTGGQGGQGGVWGSFIGPVIWSAYGKQGLDGDGVEYIYYAGLTAPVGNYLPSSWSVDSAGYQEPEFIPAAYKGTTPNQSGKWYDDPVDLEVLGSGYKQWVSVRKKRSATEGAAATWGPYSDIALWAYFGKDGDAGTGIIADLTNDIIPISLDGDGLNYACETYTDASLLNNAAAAIPAVIDLTTLKVLSGNSDITSTAVSGGWFTRDTNNTSRLLIDIPAEAINLGETNLLVTFDVTASVEVTVDGQTTTESVTRTASLTFVGVHFGTDGLSYDLVVAGRSIKKTGGVNSPSEFAVYLRKTDATNTLVTKSKAEVEADSTLNAMFQFRYCRDTWNDTFETWTGSNISTSGVDTFLRIGLFYKNPNVASSTWIRIDEEDIWVVSDGVSPDPAQLRLTSTVFKRSTSRPNRPGTGTTPGSSSFGGTYSDPVPYGWSDSIPSGGTALWQTTRLFTSDGNAPQDATWSLPVIAGDVDGEYDIEFAERQTNDAVPADPKYNYESTGGNTGNRGSDAYSSNKIWFDPSYDTNKDYTQMYWKAERWFINGVPTAWAKTRIKGEKGDTGETGATGADGQSNLYIDLTNEMSGVAVSDSNAVLSATQLITTVKAYYGTTPLVLSNVTFTGVPSGITATAATSGGSYTGDITFAVAQNAVLSDTTEITINAVTATHGTLTAVFSIVALKQGASATYYELVPSVNVVSKTPSGNKSVSNVTVSVNKVEGGSMPVTMSSSEIAAAGLSITYKIDSGSETAYASAGASTASLASQIVFYLRFNTVLIDSETVPLIESGKSVSAIFNWYKKSSSSSEVAPAVQSGSLAANEANWVSLGWQKDFAPQLDGTDKNLFKFQVFEFTDGSFYRGPSELIRVYDDVGYLKDVFGEYSVQSSTGALLKNLIGVTDSSNPPKVVAMINASDIGEDSEHGKLLIAGGMNGINSSAGINAATFKVYEDGHIVAQDGSIGPFTVDGTTLRSEWTNDATYGSSGQFELDAQSLYMNMIGQGGINRGTFCIGYNTGADPTTINYPVCSITSSGENSALRLTGSSTGNALDVYGKANFVGKSTFTDLDVTGSAMFSGLVYRMRRPIVNPEANTSITLDPLVHHTVIVRNDNVVVNLPNSSLTGDEYEIITSGKTSAIHVDAISSATVIGGGSKTDYSPGATISLPANYQYTLLYNGAEWVITKH